MNLTHRFLIPVFAAALLAACAATVNRGGSEGPRFTVAPAATSKVLLAMTGPGGADSGPDWEAFKEEWQTSLTAALAAQGGSFAFASAASAAEVAGAAPAVLLKMQVKEYRYVSQAKRYAVGIFTGNASFDIEVEFIELPANKSLGKRKYSAESSAMQGVFAAMTPKQVEAAAKEIAQELRAQ